MVTNMGIRSLLPMILEIGNGFLNFASETLASMARTFSQIVEEVIPRDGTLGDALWAVIDPLFDFLGIGNMTLFNVTFGLVGVLFVLDFVNKFRDG